LNLDSRCRSIEIMARSLTIGQLAAAAEVPTSTVRYYERAGLLSPSSRSAGNYRLYSEEDLARLRFIRAAQATGFTLDDVHELLRPAPCGEVQARIEARIEQVRTRMRELRHVERVLRASLETCRLHQATGRCAVIEDLSAQAQSKSRT